MAQPLISICIPAYKKPQYVVRCLQSILKQSYKQVEIIISDDSPDEDIKIAIQPLTNQLSIRYFHNQPALKSPRNWNAALDKAEGDLIVLMHQDDWYHSPTAIEEYVKVFEKHPEVDFVFCQNTAIDESGNKIILQERKHLLNELSEKPNHLLLSQIIGPPSNTMLRKSITTRYDERLIWLVDVDYYARMLKAGYKYYYIDKHLVSIGLHQDQTTVFCRTNDDIIFKENILVAGKLEQKAFKDVLIYDYYWRLLRNYGIRNIEDIKSNGLKKDEIPEVILQMLRLQQKLPKGFLKNGVFSKTAMSLAYGQWNLSGQHHQN